VATLDNRILFLGVVLLCWLTQCGTKDISRSFDVSQANRLLTADTEKVWSLTSRTESGVEVFSACLEDNTITFVKARTDDSLYVMGRTTDCELSTAVEALFSAKYTLDDDGNDVFQNVLSLKEETPLSIGTIQVDELTSSRLKVSYIVDGTPIQEKYSY